ncbi:hypothetical protein ACIRD3_39370 [Kitasatospora sp. NPDC093550]|uniref:hypothetical protein n=1 Tax=Kitasatospora sp. NPDC093550 TaxID=3364089 RepID=UPI00381644EB
MGNRRKLKFKPIGTSGVAGRCSGQQLDHKDGSMSCSRGPACPGVALPHNGWRNCDRYGPCEFCEGPPVTWIHDDDHPMAGVTVHTVRSEEDLAAAMEKMIPTPKNGDWRPDVIGVDKLSMQPGPDGWPLVNGHRLTREMCAELQADRPEQADHFVFEDMVEMAQIMGPPEFDGPLFGRPW